MLDNKKKVKIKCPVPNCENGYIYGHGAFGKLGITICFTCKGKGFVLGEIIE